VRQFRIEAGKDPGAIAFEGAAHPRGQRQFGVPRNQRHPSPAERDERVKVDLPPDEFIKGVVDAGEHPEDEETEN
jgi:hypothetical protein